MSRARSDSSFQSCELIDCAMAASLTKTKPDTSLLKNKKKKAKAKSKGKVKSLSSSSAAKRYRSVPASQLPWKATRGTTYSLEDFQGEGGMLELEEIDGVDVVWEETATGGRTVKFNVSLLRNIAAAEKSCDHLSKQS